MAELDDLSKMDSLTLWIAVCTHIFLSVPFPLISCTRKALVWRECFNRYVDIRHYDFLSTFPEPTSRRLETDRARPVQLLRRGAETSHSKDLIQRMVRLTLETNALTGNPPSFRSMSLILLWLTFSILKLLPLSSDLLFRWRLRLAVQTWFRE